MCHTWFRFTFQCYKWLKTFPFLFFLHQHVSLIQQLWTTRGLGEEGTSPVLPVQRILNDEVRAGKKCGETHFFWLNQELTVNQWLKFDNKQQNKFFILALLLLFWNSLFIKHRLISVSLIYYFCKWYLVIQVRHILYIWINKLNIKLENSYSYKHNHIYKWQHFIFIDLFYIVTPVLRDHPG